MKVIGPHLPSVESLDELSPNGLPIHTKRTPADADGLAVWLVRSHSGPCASLGRAAATVASRSPRGFSDGSSLLGASSATYVRHVNPRLRSCSVTPARIGVQTTLATNGKESGFLLSLPEVTCGPGRVPEAVFGALSAGTGPADHCDLRRPAAPHTCRLRVGAWSPSGAAEVQSSSVGAE
jgi:hypothetical protein